MIHISRWLSRAITIALIAVLLLLVPIYINQEIPSLLGGESLGSNLGFFLAINLNIVVIMVLGFMVVRNLVKLFLDRRKRILGSRLRARLVFAFVGLSLIPTVLLFLVAKGILGSSLQEWFAPQVVRAVDSAIGVAQYHYDYREAELYRQLNHLSEDLSRLSFYLNDLNSVDGGYGMAVLEEYLADKLDEYGLSQLELLNTSGALVMIVRSAQLEDGPVRLPGLNRRSLQRAWAGEALVLPEQSLNGEFLRGYAAIEIPVARSAITGLLGDAEEEPRELLTQLSLPTSGRVTVVATEWILPELSETLSRVISAYDDYRELNTYRRPLASSYTLTLVIVTLMIVFAAVWVGFYLARSLAEPIRELASGTQEIAQGNLEYRIPDVGDDELSVLVNSFNAMTEDLQRKTGELVARRNYMETVLASVGVGVVSIDSESRITTLNVAASDIIGLEEDLDQALGRPLADVFPSELAEQMDGMLTALYPAPEQVFTTTFALEHGGVSKQIQITINKLLSESGGTLGAVMLFDDLTELVSAQRMAAWREVARRIAHEIKNPLTPIQLSAQRMQRRFVLSEQVEDAALSAADKQVIADGTETIVRQVEALRTLVNEFSRFARMPKSHPIPSDLNSLVQETTALYREAHPDISIRQELDRGLPVVDLDREQIRRAMVNLLDNGVASVRARMEGGDANPPMPLTKNKKSGWLRSILSEERPVNRFQPEIVISSRFDPSVGLVSLEVSDNGIGIADADKPKLFEPYFTTKRGGTGLGLAIVNTIVADHDGFVRVRDNRPSGVIFSIELPAVRDAEERQAQG